MRARRFRDFMHMQTWSHYAFVACVMQTRQIGSRLVTMRGPWMDVISPWISRCEKYDFDVCEKISRRQIHAVMMLCRQYRRIVLFRDVYRDFEILSRVKYFGRNIIRRCIGTDRLFNYRC